MIVTETLILTNIIFFLLIVCNRLDWTELGSCYELSVKRGQIARLLTVNFTHRNFIHILCNMYSLWNIGTVIEEIFNGGKVLLIYLVTGIAGNLISALIRNRMGKGNILSIGASGSICGLLGVFIVYVLSLRGGSAVPYLVKALLPMLVLSFSPRVDTVAHLSCLMCGVAFAFAII